jgi:hypothetical protein
MATAFTGSRHNGWYIFPMDFEPLTVVCAWCAAVVHTGGERVSHGICVDCASGFLAKLPAEYLSTIAEPDGTVTLFGGHKWRVLSPEF